MLRWNRRSRLSEKLIMYEMWVGESPAGEELVWHVVAADRATTLCGRRKISAVDSAEQRTDRHCMPCMAAFQAALEAPARPSA